MYDMYPVETLNDVITCSLEEDLVYNGFAMEYLTANDMQEDFCRLTTAVDRPIAEHRPNCSANLLLRSAAINGTALTRTKREVGNPVKEMTRQACGTP